MSERSGGGAGRGTESTQPGRNDRNFGKRRRRRKTRRLGPNQTDQRSAPPSVQTGSGPTPFGGLEDSAADAGTQFHEKDADQAESFRASEKPANRNESHKENRRTGNRSRRRHKGFRKNGSDNNASHLSHATSAQKKTFRKSPVYAALDLGTNNCRLLIAVPRPRGRFRVIDGFSRIVRLGEGLSQTGELSQAATDRAIEALKICASKLGNRDIRSQRLIATEACRQAKNGAHFLKRVKDETGLDLEVVTRETEARLAAEGCGSLMDAKSDAAVMFDIGGGSTELILVKGDKRRRGKVADRIVDWTSLPMGVVTLAERFGGKDVNNDLFTKMTESVIEEIHRFEGRSKLSSSFQSGYAHLLGTSGTVTTLAGIHLGLERYDRRKVDGLWLRSEEIDGVIAQLLGMNYKQRASNPCIGNERADLVLAGCAILEAIRKVWPSERLRVADRGLREGLLAEMMNADRVWHRPQKQRGRSHNADRTSQ